MSLIAILLTTLSSAQANTKTLCAYDPGGKSGDYFRILEEYTLQAGSWGAPMELRAYTDEETAVKDYEAGQCDAVMATGVRLQRFNRFPTTLEAVGALPEKNQLKQMVKTLTTSPAARGKLVANGHETAGIIPIGPVYLFVRDRSIDTVGELAGKKIATLDYDRPSVVMVNRVGAVMTPADLGTLGPKFNNGEVDACYISAPAFKPFELEKGLGSKGGVVKLPLAQATLQVLVHQDRFPEGFGQKSREFFYGKFDSTMALVDQAEAGIGSNYWINLPESKIPEFDDMFLGVRLQLRDVEKSYDPQMLSVMRKLRCDSDPARAECAEKKE
jgi:hypothetical protein